MSNGLSELSAAIPAVVAATAAFTGAAVTALTVGGAAQSAARSADTLAPVANSVVVTMRGNGHGHGLSQYGAQGAALAGKSYRQIVRFYYPHTKLVRRKSPLIAVKLSGFGATTTVAAVAGLRVSGVAGTLPTAGVKRYRLVAAAGTGLTLQELPAQAGAKWRRVAALANGATFRRTGSKTLRLYARGGASTAYHGWLRAVRRQPSGRAGGVFTVNRVGINNYTAGVVPREMPASWRRAALDAQAVAARTYASYEMQHAASSDYDICDTSMCQVYGGAARYDAAGNLLWRDLQRAARDTTNRVLTYRGAPIFAQFSASNGGWTVAGGQPYLVARRDPYDDKSSGDPYLAHRERLPSGALAASFGLSRLTRLQITKRDGHGAAGGRVLAGYAAGTTAAGVAKRVPFDGFDLAAAVGAGTTWISVRNAT
ncbi:SpoIID/LytB domain-containing protein [uncultured Jatrophihabitans sp.]|uniref:SpoIID/LytB domain-containing protein n=1 Tax=uncultured Jatrophihabitans sp. TaxID=1610747 RepID=UPI0035CAD9E3